MVGGAEFAGERGFRTFLIVIEYVNVKTPLHAHQACQQSHRTGAGDQQGLRRPDLGTPADALDVIPCLGEDAGRLEQHAE